MIYLAAAFFFFFFSPKSTDRMKGLEQSMCRVDAVPCANFTLIPLFIYVQAITQISMQSQLGSATR